MSRKDTIMITVLINLGILSILFATAIIYDDDKTLDSPVEVEKSLAAAPAPKPIPKVEPVKAAKAMPVIVEVPTDEVDHMLNTYVNGDGQEISVFEDEVQEQTLPVTEETKTVAAAPPSAPAADKYVEVTVKKGDALEKIARANNTTIAAIVKENNLKNERLSVGQVLRIPVAKKKESQPIAEAKAPTPKKEPVSASSEKQYYIVKSGDSPWKIAKQFGIKFEDLLKMNNLNEEKARNLKVGDKLRVK